MPTVSTLRAIGVVIRSRVQSGVAKTTGNPYSMNFVTVGDSLTISTAEVHLPDGMTPPAVGTRVDWLVEVAARGGFLSADFIGDYPAAPAKAA